jgi:hypothetical protein
MSVTRVNIGAYQTRFNGRMGDFKRGVLLKLFGAVVKDTPVLTGRLRANWLFSQDAPMEGSSLAANQTDDPTPIITEGVQSIKDGDGEYFLTNNLPYANRIEYEGWSSVKAPAGMVRKNLVRIARILAQQKTQSK